jgi:hypothetical protein
MREPTAIRSRFERGSGMMNRGEPETDRAGAEGHFVSRGLKTVRNANGRLARIRVERRPIHSHRPLGD